ncbi:MAG TPA: RIP metalloprotease RseP [Gemmatimonadaceae bacterium]|jgi:regulator of sigma E protease|nr:RIP metalloprotease RseP [Gemmatimonadaceae bacterium]
MLEWLRTPAAIVFVFGIVIFVHELGHFIAAKLMGVYAPRFSIGFGPALWSHKWGETEYILAALPLGGYVRMASREDESMAFLEGGAETPVAEVGASGAKPVVATEVPPEEKKPRYYDPNAMAPFGPRPVPENRWLESKPLAARLFIMLAGVTMNFVLGFLIIAGMYIANGEVLIPSREVGSVLEFPGADSAFRNVAAGDTIIAVDGRAVNSWNEVVERISTDSGKVLRLQTNRGESEIAVRDSGIFSREQIALSVLSPYIPPIIDRVVPGHPAEAAGLQRGDSIIAVNGTAVRGWMAVVSRIEASPAKPITLTLVRGNSTKQVAITPEASPGMNPITMGDTVVGKIGAMRREYGTRRALPLGTAIGAAWTTTWTSAGLIVRTLRNLLTGHQSLKGLSGPVGVAVQSGEAAQQGWASLLLLISILSINLAVVNLLPIPILDGGQILIILIETVKGGALAVRTRIWLFYTGLAAIVLLFSIVTFNDLTPLVKRILQRLLHL